MSETSDFMEKVTVYETATGMPVKPYYMPSDVKGGQEEKIGVPGSFPFTRGAFPEIYRTRLWTRRVLCGFGTPSDTNQRLKYLIQHGERGVSVVPDILTLMGFDADHPMSTNESGAMGAPFSSLADMEEMLAGLDLGSLGISFHTPWISAAMNQAQFVVAAQKMGYSLDAVRGSMQNNFLDVFTCGGDRTSPLDMGLRLCLDIIEDSVKNMKHWYPINLNAYDIGEHGAAPHEELGYVLGMAVTYVDGLLARGLPIDDFAPRLSFSLSAGMDFFESIAKMRALRRMWAKMMRDRWGAKKEKSMKAMMSVHTAGSSLVAQQPLNNITRGTIEALAAALGGCQALDICCYDEPLSLPTEASSRVALATQYIIAQEAGVCAVTDPLGGSYYVEALTDGIEEKAFALLKEIEDAGGMPELIRTGKYQAALEAANYAKYSKVMDGSRPVIGVNHFVVPPEEDFQVPIHRNPPESARQHSAAVAKLRKDRDNAKVRETLIELRKQAATKANLMPALIEATRAYATVGECVGVIRQAYGLAYDPFGMTQSPID